MSSTTATKAATEKKAPKKSATVSVATAMSKSIQTLSYSIVDELKKKLIDEGEFDDEVKLQIEIKLDEYKESLKTTLKATKKKQKSVDTKDKPKKQPTKYNQYQKVQTAYYKENNPEISNKDRFRRIATEWKDVKDTWEPPSDDSSSDKDENEDNNDEDSD